MGPGSLVTGHTVLDWIEARGAVTGEPFPGSAGSGLARPADMRRLADRHDQRDF